MGATSQPVTINMSPGQISQELDPDILQNDWGAPQRNRNVTINC